MFNLVKKLPSPLKGILNLVFLCLHTLFWCTPMYIVFFFKILSPRPAWRAFFDKPLSEIANGWIKSNNFMMQWPGELQWDLPDFSHLKFNDWYFIICNHQSWTDILTLHKIFLKKTPFIRFFIKKELCWLPVLNLAWWVYDFPIMQRHSQRALRKNPALRLNDLETTKKACGIYQYFPVTILNFIEGTRFTPEKHQAQKSPYQHLLVPKSAGFAFAIQCMDKKIHHVLDVTIIYPEGKKTFWDLMCGRIEKIVVKLTEREIPETFLENHYSENALTRKAFKDWIQEIWQEKDKLIAQTLKKEPL